jgi:serine/threonine protein kinase
MIEPGTILVDKYRIEHVLAKGGMGIVARAHHLILDVPVAIKFLLPDMLEHEETVQRFLREAQAAAKLKSEHVSRIIDVGLLETGAPYLVMEYLAGIDLKDLLRRHGRLDPGFAVDLALQACEALAEAHALDIVHRDVKPSNLFLTQGSDGAPLLKLLDFGVSKAPGTMIKGITKSQAIIGTPAYMSPEQMASSKNVDARTDIWSLGAMLYELVSGRRPFRGDNFGQLVVTVTTHPLTPLDDIDLPDGLAAVIARCLEKEAAHRFQTTAELAVALAPYAGTHSQAIRSTERTARVLEMATGSGLAIPALGEAGEPDESSDTSHSTIRASSGEQTPPLQARPAPPAPAAVAAGADPYPTSALTARREAPRRRWRTAVAATAGGLAGLAMALVLVMRAEPDRAAGPAVEPPADRPATPAGAASPAPDGVTAHSPAAAGQHLLEADAGAPASVGIDADQEHAAGPATPDTRPGDDAAQAPDAIGEAANTPAAPERAARQQRKRRKPSTGASRDSTGKASKTRRLDQSKLEDAFGTRD